MRLSFELLEDGRVCIIYGDGTVEVVSSLNFEVNVDDKDVTVNSVPHMKGIAAEVVVNALALVTVAWTVTTIVRLVLG